MGRSSAPDYEVDEHSYDDFDPRLDFSKFLEEAKLHATEDDMKASSALSHWGSEEEGRKKEKKSKRSWKNTLFWWLKKSEPRAVVKPETSPHIHATRRVHVSGPIYSGAKAIDGRPRRHPMSGPIATLFNPSKGMDSEIPYMCLHQLTSPNTAVHSYGPVYLVT